MYVYRISINTKRHVIFYLLTPLPMSHEHTNTRAHEHTSTRTHEHTSTRAYDSLTNKSSESFLSSVFTLSFPFTFSKIAKA